MQEITFCLMRTWLPSTGACWDQNTHSPHSRYSTTPEQPTGARFKITARFTLPRHRQHHRTSSPQHLRAVLLPLIENELFVIHPSSLNKPANLRSCSEQVGGAESCLGRFL